MNLEEQLRREFIDHREFWNYYGQDLESPFESIESAKQFINNYFNSGSKEYAVYEWQGFEGEEMSFRNGHSANVFFIGAMLQRMIDPDLLIESRLEGRSYPFSYLWYLTCLAHDFGYMYENDKNESQIEEIKEKYKGLCFSVRENRRYPRLFFYKKAHMNIKRLVPNIPLRECGCYYRGYSMATIQHIHKRECNHSCRGTLKYSNGTIIKRPWYNYSIRDNYFKYRLMTMNTLDHGIVGADQLFSGLIDNYRKEFNENLRDGCYENFHNNQNRYFCCEQFKVFAYIANCIAAHNVFMSPNKEESKQLYSEYGLECLWPENFRKIDYQEDPLLFVLCVADTLEPSKRFREMNSVNILKMIGISYDKESNTVCIEIETKLTHSEEGTKYIKDIRSLEQWCEINTKVIFI